MKRFLYPGTRLATITNVMVSVAVLSVGTVSVALVLFPIAIACS